MPKTFIDRVMYIVLENVDFGRGETTRTNYNKASATLILYSKHSDKALSRRAEVLKELNVDEENAWGKDILIYCNSVVIKRTLGMKG
eukprot:13992503-Ditylum_brightwellii.AAC.1